MVLTHEYRAHWLKIAFAGPSLKTRLKKSGRKALKMRLKAQA